MRFALEVALPKTVGGGGGDAAVNGEMVEREVRYRQRVEGWRALVAGFGFVMGVVGIWGDGA